MDHGILKAFNVDKETDLGFSRWEMTGMKRRVGWVMSSKNAWILPQFLNSKNRELRSGGQQGGVS